MNVANVIKRVRLKITDEDKDFYYKNNRFDVDDYLVTDEINFD